MEHEGLIHLLTDSAHWQFELITTLAFDLLTFLLIVPIMSAWRRHHKDDHAELDNIKNRLSNLEKHGTGTRETDR